MTLTPQIVSEVLRQRLNLPDDSQAARIIAQIPSSLKEFARRYAADAFTRPLVSTDKSTTSLVIGTGGKVNLVTGYDTYQFLLEYIDLGQIYLLPAVTVAGSPATGTYTFAKPISDGDTIIVNGVTFTYSTELGPTNIYFTEDQEVNAANTATKLNSSADPLLTVASYTSEVSRDGEGPTVIITYDTNGTAGNAFTLVGAGSSVVASGATLTGGASAIDTDADTITINTLANNFTNLDRVRFTTTGVLPTGISAATDYYLINYSVTTGVGIGQLSSTANGLTLVNISTAGSGVLTMTKMDATGNQMQKLRNPQQMALPQYLSNVFNYFTVQGNSLFIQQIDGVYPTGTIACALPFYPTTLALLPESAEAEALFLSILFDQCTMIMPKARANG